MPLRLQHALNPSGGGLSSSAALICSSMLAILAALGGDLLVSSLKGEVAAAAAKAERYVGVASGGMDQAISMTGMKGVAKRVRGRGGRDGCKGRGECVLWSCF